MQYNAHILPIFSDLSDGERIFEFQISNLNPPFHLIVYLSRH
jgi:hypothetical protein